ncbi:MAG TPA: nucleotidyltransferase domain-containing protein [Bacillales bacterium]|nr:nucleotidyltransferase domain-containing protein [Bacillales bacterium]
MNERDHKQINILVDQIRKEVPVKQIILFGSMVNGNQKEDSDIDLCVIIEQNNQRRLDVIRQLRRAIAPVVAAPVDLLLYNQDEFEERAGNESTLEHQIKLEGVRVDG